MAAGVRGEVTSRSKTSSASASAWGRGAGYLLDGLQRAPSGQVSHQARLRQDGHVRRVAALNPRPQDGGDVVPGRRVPDPCPTAPLEGRQHVAEGLLFRPGPDGSNLDAGAVRRVAAAHERRHETGECQRCRPTPAPCHGPLPVVRDAPTSVSLASRPRVGIGRRQRLLRRQQKAMSGRDREGTHAR